jgi:hypothetical protein
MAEHFNLIQQWFNHISFFDTKEIFFFLFGSCFAFCVFIIFSPSKSGRRDSSPFKKLTAEDDAMVKFYLNIFFMDKQNLVDKVIHKKFSDKSVLVRAIVSRLVKEKTVLERITVNLCEKIKNRFESIGITCFVSVLHNRSSYVCLELSLTDVRIDVFLSSFTKLEISRVEQIITWLTFWRLLKPIKMMILHFMIPKMKMKLSDQLSWKLLDQMDIDVEVLACSERDQGVCLFVLSIIIYLSLVGPNLRVDRTKSSCGSRGHR